MSKQIAAIKAECEDKGLAYCKAKAELSFGARRQALLDWINAAEIQVKAREQDISQALAMQQSAQAAKQSARKSARLASATALVLALVTIVAVVVQMNFDFSALFK